MEERNIVSQTDAILTVRELKKSENEMYLDPCDQPEGKSNTCQFKDPSLKTLCKHPDGLLSDGDNKVFCPRQKGELRIISKTTEK